MNKTELSEYIRSISSGLEVKEGRQFAEVAVPAGLLHKTALELRDDKKVLFDFLDCITGVDFGTDLGVIYHLHSTEHKHTIVLKVRTSDRNNPHFDSVTDIWNAADLFEREVFDLFGIKFTNHPDLRRLFLDSSWGFPFRKDYTDDIRIVTK